MSVTLQERLKLLQDVSKSWLELMRSLRGLTDAQIERPATIGNWSVKQVMGHIAYWDEHLIRAIRAVEDGEPITDEDEPAEVVNDRNHIRAAADAEREVSAVKAEMDSTHQKLMDLLEVTPVIAADLIRDDTYEHYPEHTAAIRAWRATQEKAG